MPTICNYQVYQVFDRIVFSINVRLIAIDGSLIKQRKITFTLLVATSEEKITNNQTAKRSITQHDKYCIINLIEVQRGNWHRNFEQSFLLFHYMK